jgi:alkenylglycerophosphocholine/alkenylglycerophosphoethanolamine hydrolase
MELMLLALFGVTAIVDWVAVGTGRRTLEWIAKPAALALLLLYAAANPEVSWWVLAALAFSLLGDVYLMLPADLFLAGLGAFLIGHLAYIAAFDVSTVERLLWLLGVLAVLSPVTIRIVRSIPETPLRGAVVAYIAVIALMVGSAIASGSPWAIAGAVLFAGSDAMIAWNRFVRKFSAARLAIIITYHLGQLGLVWGLR